MSLDVYLTIPGTTKLFPGQDPVYVYSANITHNLNKMASECGLYDPLWNPPEGCKAKDLIDPILKGLATLEADPTKFKKFNPPNGWGNYERLVQFAADYLHACIKYPDAIVEISK